MNTIRGTSAKLLAAIVLVVLPALLSAHEVTHTGTVVALKTAKYAATQAACEQLYVDLPFTDNQFFGVFADYNRAFIVAVVALWVASVGILAHVSRDPSRRSSRLSLFLGALWLWNAVFYHALFFTRINPAAWLFAGLFLIQAVLFLWTAAHRHIEYFSSTGWTRVGGLGLIGYALLYPLLTIAFGHRYPAAPTFGVPCPTDILTIGAFLTSGGRVPAALAIVPIIWALIGGSAALLLSVATDYVLLGAGALLATLLIGQRFHPSVS